MTRTLQEIGVAVAKFRKTVGMKQITLAMEAGVTERTVQRIEKGEKVNDESLRAIANAFRIDENYFIRNVLSEEEAVKTLENMKLIEAHRFATLKDAEAVLGTHGMVLDDHFVTDEAAQEAASFKDLLRDWNDVWSVMVSAEEILNACRSLLNAAKALETRGYVIRYGVYRTADDYRLVTMLFARKADDVLCKVKQFCVRNQLTQLRADSVHPRLSSKPLCGPNPGKSISGTPDPQFEEINKRGLLKKP
jgi:transcriptional regulator with XRE-family HTH domain